MLCVSHTVTDDSWPQAQTWLRPMGTSVRIRSGEHTERFTTDQSVCVCVCGNQNLRYNVGFDVLKHLVDLHTTSS